MKEKLQMSIKEAERLGIMRQIDKKALTIKGASEELALSPRQVKRIRKRYREKGEEGLISQKRGQASHRKIGDEVRRQVIGLMKTNYLNFGPTLAAEKLKEREKIQLSAETVRKWLIEEGLWKAKRRKEARAYQRRARRSRFGELLQGDGSPHDWFEGRSDKCTLLLFVDDATSNTTAAQFVPSETTEGYLGLLKEHLKSTCSPIIFPMRSKG
jgi:transposase